MIKLYVVRHGETEHNREGRIQGQSDSDLTLLGIRQAQIAAQRLVKEEFSAIYSSDLGRAKRTADIIAERVNLPVRITPLLREAAFGVIQGMTEPEIEAKFPAVLHEWRRNKYFRPPDAETHEQVVERCAQFIEQVIKNHSDNERILTICHGGSVRGLMVAALGMPIELYRRLHVSNVSLSILEVGERPSLWLFNDTSHLDSMETNEEDIENVAH